VTPDPSIVETICSLEIVSRSVVVKVEVELADGDITITLVSGLSLRFSAVAVALVINAINNTIIITTFIFMLYHPTNAQ
jgi:hypothetical protein